MKTNFLDNPSTFVPEPCVILLMNTIHMLPFSIEGVVFYKSIELGNISLLLLIIEMSIDMHIMLKM